MKRHNRQLTDRLAAEYVLGTLHGRARARFERWLKADATVRRQVEDWELKLNPLAADAVAETPPPTLWPALEQRLFAPAADATAATRNGGWQRLALWRTLAVGSSALAALLAAVLVLKPAAPPAETGSDYIVLIQNRQQEPVWAATAPSDFNQLLVRNTKRIDVPSGRACLLWVQPAGSSELYPLGLLPDDGSTVKLPVDTPLRSLLMDGRLVVTLENPDMRPTEPTSSAEYVGKIVALTEDSI